jgi:hypothetical protein
MKEIVLEIKPKEGLGPIHFGEPMEKMVDLLGEPEDVDNLEDEDEFSTVILNYWDEGITAFIEGIEKQVLSCFEITNKKALLFGKWVFDLNLAQVTALMQEKGYKEIDESEEEWGEHRLTFEDALIDFFFEGGILVSVSWGVLVNDKGEIEEV